MTGRNPLREPAAGSLHVPHVTAVLGVLPTSDPLRLPGCTVEEPCDPRAGSAPGTVFAVDGPASETSWVTHLLTSDAGLGFWTLQIAQGDRDYLSGLEANKALTDRGDLSAAWQWAARVLEDPCGSEQQMLDGDCADVGVAAIPLRVTEWRMLRFRDEPGWVPLFNTTRPCSLPFSDLALDTAADCPYRRGGRS